MFDPPSWQVGTAIDTQRELSTEGIVKCEGERTQYFMQSIELVICRFYPEFYSVNNTHYQFLKEKLTVTAVLTEP